MPRNSTGHIWLSPAFILPPHPFCLFFPLTLISDLDYIKSVEHVPYLVFSNLLRRLASIVHCVSLRVWIMCLLADWWLYSTCLGEKHREVSLAAKDPNRELWRLEECPDLKHTQTEKKNAQQMSLLWVVFIMTQTVRHTTCDYKAHSFKHVREKEHHVTCLDPQQTAVCSEMYFNNYNIEKKCQHLIISYKSLALLNSGIIFSLNFLFMQEQ